MKEIEPTMSLDYLHLPFNPIADPAAVVTAGSVRFTVLTPHLLRLEYSPTGAFEDRPSQALNVQCDVGQGIVVQDTLLFGGS